MSPSGEEVIVIRVPLNLGLYRRLLAVCGSVKVPPTELLERSILGTINRLEMVDLPQN